MIATVSRLAYSARAVIARVTIVMAIVVVLMGCARNDALSTSIEFDSNSADGLVVVGFKGSHDWLSYELIWWPIDPETKRFLGPRRDATVLRRSGNEGYAGHGSSEMRYMVFRAPPGELALHSSEVHAGYAIQVTRFRPTTAAFRIEAGEIIYIGDFELILPEKESILGKYPDAYQKPKLKSAGRSDEAAAEALKAYFNVVGTPNYRRFHNVRVQ